MEVLRNNWDSESETYDGKDECNKTKELEWTVILKKRSNHCDNFNTVTYCVELGLRAYGPITVFNRYVFNTPAMVDGMDGELGFNLEALTQDGEGLYERLAHGSIACHNVVKAVAVYPFNHGANEVIPKALLDQG